MMGISESELLNFATSYLSRSKLLWWRVTNGPAVYSMNGQTVFRKSAIAGFPDLAGLTKSGQFWAMELKTTKGKLQTNQVEWINKLTNSKAIVAVCRSPQEIIDFVDNLKKENPSQN